ncbi:MAG: class I SAM-dependent methyltransferase [Candidatus Omnitrophica bacterium]|nr:class I SAM-dependent methyltransferase [Candidatus Omnitrophota bacterium]
MKLFYKDKIKRIMKLPSPTLNYWQVKEIRKFIATFKKDSIIFNLGSGEICLSNAIINLDIKQYPCVDVVGDILSLPIKDRIVDGVIITGVLEHIKDYLITSGFTFIGRKR